MDYPYSPPHHQAFILLLIMYPTYTFLYLLNLNLRHYNIILYFLMHVTGRFCTKLQISKAAWMCEDLTFISIHSFCSGCIQTSMSLNLNGNQPPNQSYIRVLITWLFRFKLPVSDLWYVIFCNVIYLNLEVMLRRMQVISELRHFTSNLGTV
jgi:hypothetical protein